MLIAAVINVSGKAGKRAAVRCLSSVYPLLDALDMRAAVSLREPHGHDIIIPDRYSGRVSFLGKRRLNKFISSLPDGSWVIEIPAEYAFSCCDDIIRFFVSGEYRSYDAAAFTLCGSDECCYAGIRKVSADRYIPADRIRFLADSAFTEDTAVSAVTPSPLRYLALAEKYRRTDMEKAFAYINTGIYLCPESRKKELIPLVAMKAELLHEAGCYSEVCGLCEKYTPLLRKDENADRLFCTDLRSAAYDLFLRLRALGAMRDHSASGAAHRVMWAEDYLRIFNAMKTGKTFTIDRLYIDRRYSGLPFSSPVNTLCSFCADDTETAARISFRAAEWMIAGDTDEYSVLPDEAAGLLDCVPLNALKGSLLGKRLEIEAFLIYRCGMTERAGEIYRRLRPKQRAVFVRYLVGEYGPEFAQKSESFITDDEFAEMTKYAGREEFPALLLMMLAKGADISPWISRDAEGTLAAIDEIFDTQPKAPAVFAAADPDAGSTECELLALTVSFEHAAMLTAGKRDLRNTTELFELFCTYGYRYACLQFGAERCSAGDISDIPDEIKKYIIGGRAVNALAEHRYLDCVRALKEMLFTSPGSALLIGAYNEKLRRLRERSENQLRRKEKEMYSSTIKENIRFFISCGDSGRAAAMIAEYMMLNPLDPEIYDLIAEAGMTLTDLSDAPLQ